MWIWRLTPPGFAISTVFTRWRSPRTLRNGPLIDAAARMYPPPQLFGTIVMARSSSPPLLYRLTLPFAQISRSTDQNGWLTASTLTDAPRIDCRVSYGLIVYPVCFANS